MSTLGQQLANRANAQKSTGPTSAAGKARVAGNSLRHGFRSVKTVLPGEDEQAYATMRKLLLTELDPYSVEQTELAERIVSLTWRRRRAERMEAELFEQGLTGGAATLAAALVSQSREFQLLMRYTQQIVRELERVRKEYAQLVTTHHDRIISDAELMAKCSYWKADRAQRAAFEAAIKAGRSTEEAKRLGQQAADAVNAEYEVAKQAEIDARATLMARLQKMMDGEPETEAEADPPADLPAKVSA